MTGILLGSIFLKIGTCSRCYGLGVITAAEKEMLPIFKWRKPDRKETLLSPHVCPPEKCLPPPVWELVNK